jgi:hypothetical protein
MYIEEILVSGPREGAKQFGMHWCSLRIEGGGEELLNIDEWCHGRRGDTRHNPKVEAAPSALARMLDAGQASRARLSAAAVAHSIDIDF